MGLTHRKTSVLKKTK